MSRHREHRIRARLRLVEALHDGATTPGEREAAAKARERLEGRLVQLRKNDPTARFVADYVASFAVSPAPAAPEAHLPSARQLLGMLALWEAGDVSADELHAWAGLIVDQVTMPHHVQDPGAVVAEVVLQLATLHRIQLSSSHVPRIRRFVRSSGSAVDWMAWFELVAEVAAA